MPTAKKRAIRHGALYAQRRHAANRALSGTPQYAGASGKRSLAEWFAPFDSADAELRSLQTLRNRTRDLFRNAPGGRGAIKKLVSGVIGSGLQLQPSIDREFLRMSEEQAQDWQAKARQEFRIWAESKECDFMRQKNFIGLQRLAYKSQLTSGDTFILLAHKERPMMPYDLRLQMIEADRVCNPNDAADTAKIAGGIERDESGVPVAIYIRTPHPAATLFCTGNIKPTWQRVPLYGRKTGRQNVIQLLEIDRIGQTRGVPVLAPVIDTLKQVSRYSEAELSAALINAMLAVFIKRPADDPLAGGVAFDEEGNPIDASGNPVPQPWNDPDNYQLAAGSWIEGAPGYDLQTISANRPSSQYDPFFLSCMKQIGMALEIPFEVLISHFSSSYSASRAALLEFYEKVLISRDDFADNFCQPIYKEFLTEAIIKGRLIAPGFLTNPHIQLAYSGAYWVGTGLKQIDELKEINAATARIKAGISSGQCEASKIGNNVKDIIAQRAEEKKMYKECGLLDEYNAIYNPANAYNAPINSDSDDKGDKDE